MKKIFYLAVLLALLIPAIVSAQVKITAPTVSVNTGNTAADIAIQTLINSNLNSAALELENQANTEIEPYLDQDDLALGFANAGASAAHIGTQRAYSDYKRFALTVGSGFALAAPATTAEELEDAVAKIEEDGDIYFGAATQPITASLGINMGWLVENMYTTVKFGYANISDGSLTEDFSFKTLTIGALVDYQLMKSRKLPLGFVKWRGLSVGSGVLYQSNESVFKADFPFDPVTQTVPISSETGGVYDDIDVQLDIAPTLTLGVSSHSVSIPLEVTTGIRLLWLIDMNVGAGVDVAFGSSDIEAELSSPIEVSDTSNLGYYSYNDGSVSLDASTDGTGPQIIRPRLTAGLGLNLGPVKLDVPLMYYFDIGKGNSAMVGVNVGIVW